MSIDSSFNARRTGIHEADISCKQLRCFEERVSPLLVNEESRMRGEHFAAYIFRDNKDYFEWLFNDGDEYKKVASNIQLASHKQFTKASEVYVKDLFDINSALQYAVKYCQNSSSERINSLVAKFQSLQNGYIDFSNRVLRTTNIQYRDLKKALTKFFDLKKWSKFKVKFPGVLS